MNTTNRYNIFVIETVKNIIFAVILNYDEDKPFGEHLVVVSQILDKREDLDENDDDDSYPFDMTMTIAHKEMRTVKRNFDSLRRGSEAVTRDVTDWYTNPRVMEFMEAVNTKSVMLNVSKEVKEGFYEFSEEWWRVSESKMCGIDDNRDDR